ncbi:hypothetical protein PHIN3_246 [Sinorhizobium phage phiN3]|uniref:Uncharacterized protein n=1 Tax=Sinorhizobium phage phiN3 TaxID=1647405 RepID=A0A0F6WCN4_9CAUD|nr:hypothetical protein AVT40_gp287 [Sinorhizobium phage phiN3]AKF13509.2 hypothetical protein PHIN3_246 [Sinorhizobium phage phiN3]
MKTTRLALALIAFATPASACDFYKSKFMLHWALTEDDVVYSTTDTESKEPVYVVDAKDALPDGRYALAIQDTASCTFDVISGDMSRIMYFMETHVYNRIEGYK